MDSASSFIEKDFLVELRFEPLTKNNWNKFVELFGVKGACGNCWCMFYRLKKADYQEGKINDGNKNAMKQLVWSNQPTGLLGFYKDIPIAWCAFAPREDFLKLEKSRIHKRIDDQPVWSVPCTFIAKKFRRQGVSVALLKGLIKYAKENSIKIIEAYPTIPTQGRLPDVFAWVGLYKSFERAGFEIVDETSKNRPMVRYYVDTSL
ncbi:MAG: GNAT family N-acetyltransferase [Proteiniphilum sp.]|uniref:GNAT family N-acetyltransferase n=1 Tax=Proteiniphilum sp. TaxID=1926877 RepID=UPI002B1F1F97|nr:GNAT family N-acetyltransferase [Proteiniphilum sp.]MEA5128127.1 GNAT family N-acetyltransferase [Proteiniphilum sp.]